MVSTLSGNKIDGSIKKKLKELTVRVINKFWDINYENWRYLRHTRLSSN